MSTITESVEVEVDVRTAYNQWTQFETFPQFMDSVEQINQVDDKHMHWVIKVGPTTREFDATITEQRPDERISWKSDAGPEHAGAVTFDELGNGKTKVTARMTIDPESFAEKVGDKTGLLKRQVKSDMKKFKEFIEGRRGQETGAWRGEVR